MSDVDKSDTVSRSQPILAIIVTATALYGVGHLVFGPEHDLISQEHLAELQGCYSLRGEPLLRIQGSVVVAGHDSKGFKGVREKGGEVLLMDNPIQVSWQAEKPTLVTSGSSDMVPISYGPPIELRFSDGNYQEAVAVKSMCSGEYSRLAV